jgi:hypothetical protein
MYPARLAAGLRAVGIEATAVAELGLAGSADADVFAAAVAGGYVVLTENVGDFARLAAEHNIAGGHHHGLLIALSSRFSRQPAGAPTLIAAVTDAAEQSFDDRIIYLKATGPR